MEILLIVEGKTDADFLVAFIDHRFNVQLNPRRNFLKVGGKTEKLYLEVEDLKRDVPKLLLFDADDPDEPRTRQKIVEKLDELAVEVDEVFLLPNNSESGNLEMLTRKIVPEAHLPIWDCIDSYSDCNSGLYNQVLRTVDEKSKIYIYINSFKSDQFNIKERNYGQDVLWDLNSKHLDPLFNFFEPYFS